MAELFHSGIIIDGVLAFMFVELIVLILVRKYRLPAPHNRGLIANMGAGATLLLALREALVGGAWQRIALWLLVALVFHVWDLTQRWSTARTDTFRAT